MFSEILKIIPRLDNKDLAQLERSLNTRFSRVAKKFGGGVMAALKGGGIAGIALGLIDKLLNPLKETQEAIDRTLKASDDLVTNAKQFNTTPGRLAKIQAFAGSTGLDPGTLSMMMTKFQTAVAEATQDPSKNKSVKNFVGEKDIAAAFFEFIQALQTMDSTQRLLVQQEVFGEKLILKQADLLNTDMTKLNKFFAKFDSDQLTKALNKTADLNDLTETLAQVRNLDDIQKKSSIINEGMVLSRDKSERFQLARENERIQSYKDLRAISDTSDRIFGLVETGVLQLGKFISFVTPAITKIVEAIERFSKNNPFKKFFGMKGD